jgi:hypothetical protein
MYTWWTSLTINTFCRRRCAWGGGVLRPQRPEIHVETLTLGILTLGIILLVADNLEAMERGARATTLAVVPEVVAATTNRKRSFAEQCLDAMSSSAKEDAIAAPSTPIKDTTARYGRKIQYSEKKNRLIFYLTFT